MLLLNDLPGVTANATFKVGKKANTTDLDVDLKQASKFNASLDANNFGSDLTGQGRIGGSISVNGLAGMGDALGVRLLGSEDGGTVYGSIDYSLAIGGHGTRIGARYSTLDSDVGGAFATLELDSEAETSGLFVTHPFVRSRDFNLYGQTSIERRDVDQIFGGDLAGISTEDAIKVFTLAVSGDYRDDSKSGGVSTYGLSLHRGMDNLDPALTSRVGAEGKFLKVGVTYNRLQRLNSTMNLRLKLAGQFADDSMVSSEQMSLGGPNAVRAFINGERLADSGVIVTAELQQQLPWQIPYVNNAHVIGFYDFGVGAINNPRPGDEDNFSIEGIGLGLKLGLVGDYQVGLSYAHSVSGEALTDDDDGQFLLQAIKWFE
jgi:hemolysin activation/secretion protein